MEQKRSSRISKITLSFGLVLVSAVYIAWQRNSELITATETPKARITPGQSFKDANDALLKTLAEIEIAAQRTAALASTATPTPSTPQSEPSPSIASAYRDGSYTGDAIDAYYGMVQVKAVVRNGLITDVQFLQHPHTRTTSVHINGQAMPLLTQEAIQTQHAQVDGVSGATFTSEAFRQSLASALAQAS